MESVASAYLQPVLAMGGERRVEVKPIANGHVLLHLYVEILPGPARANLKSRTWHSSTCMLANLQALHFTIVDDLAAGHTDIMDNLERMPGSARPQQADAQG